MHRQGRMLLLRQLWGVAWLLVSRIGAGILEVQVPPRPGLCWWLALAMPCKTVHDLMSRLPVCCVVACSICIFKLMACQRLPTHPTGALA